MDTTLLVGILFIIGFNILDFLSNRFLNNDFLSTFSVILFFFFIYANVDPVSAPFYLIMAVIVLLFTVGRNAIQQIRIENRTSIGIPNPLNDRKIKLSGPVFYLANMIFGVGTFMIMWGSLNTSDVNKLQSMFGVPYLSITALKATLGPATVVALSIIENRFIIIVFEFITLLKNVFTQVFGTLFTGIVALLPFLAFLLAPSGMILTMFMATIGPIVLAAGFFAIMHLLVYQLAFQAIFFAFAIMTFWLIIYKITGNDIVMNNGHMDWNLLIHYLRTRG